MRRKFWELLDHPLLQQLRLQFLTSSYCLKSSGSMGITTVAVILAPSLNLRKALQETSSSKISCWIQKVQLPHNITVVIRLLFPEFYDQASQDKRTVVTPPPHLSKNRKTTVSTQAVLLEASENKQTDLNLSIYTLLIEILE